ncbi:MAG: hypothetical protein DWI00_03075 [Planctomycetota bacterium]|nr:MAG: hypothetical protein DWI00_03075 [Planctomycetota bacterium]
MLLRNTKDPSSTAVKAPPPTVHPLDNNDEFVRLLCEATGESRNTVFHRLIDEEACLGSNVRRDLNHAGVRPHVWSDQQVELHRTTRSVLYETFDWNGAPLRLEQSIVR